MIVFTKSYGQGVQLPRGAPKSDTFLELVKTLFTEEGKVWGGRITDA